MRATTQTSRVPGPAKSGFTLIELLVTIAIIGVLAALLLAGVSKAVARARATSAARSVDALVLGVRQFDDQFGFLPPLVHDGVVISDGSPGFRPLTPIDGQRRDGPVVDVTVGNILFKQLVVWSEGADSSFFRRRTGTGGDAVELPSGGVWNDDSAWDDRRYSKYGLAYYLTGVGDKDLDGVRGPGLARPQSNGLFVGVGYPVGSSRDRYEPVIEGDTDSMRLITGYFDPDEYGEHGFATPTGFQPPDTHVAFTDPWGRAIRYYRWEPGRLVNGQFVVETTLDLNIPAVLLDPSQYAAVGNDPNRAKSIDLTGGNAELRAARFAIVSAGPDGLFGTEPTDVLADRLGRSRPTTLDDKIALRKRAWQDNIVGLGH